MAKEVTSFLQISLDYLTQSVFDSGLLTTIHLEMKDCIVLEKMKNILLKRSFL